MTAAAPPSNPAGMNGGGGGTRADLEWEIGRLSFGLGTAKENELPSEFNMAMEVEQGRRATIGKESDIISGVPEDGRQSIEQGRRLDSPRPSLPFSPLRASSMGEKGREAEGGVVPMDDDYDLNDPVVPRMDEDLFIARSSNGNAELQRNSLLPPPPQTVHVKTSRQQNRRHRRRKLADFDEETELSSGLVQQQVRDPQPILLAKCTRLDDLFLDEDLSVSKQIVPQAGGTETLHNNHQGILDDDYAFEPEIGIDLGREHVHEHQQNIVDYTLNNQYQEDLEMIESRPKTPRLSSPPPPAHGNVPDVDHQQMTPHEGSSTLEPIQDALNRYRQAFVTSNAKSMSFKDLLPSKPRRKQVAEAFLQMLLLKSNNLIQVSQPAPYASISITPTTTLFTT